MEFDIVIYQKLIEMALETSVPFLARMLKKPSVELEQDLHKSFTVNIRKAVSFSDTISVFKLPNTKEIFSNSIELEIAKQNRLFRLSTESSIIDELSLLNSPDNIILLGDVGAGKTTTLKRLIKVSFNQLFAPNSDFFRFSYPIVVRLGEIKRTDTLTTHLCKQLGISYQINEVKEYYTIRTTEREKIFDEDRQESFLKEKEIESEKEKITYEYKIGDYSIELGLGEFLNNLKTIIFLDGLDELNFLIKDNVFEDIKNLSQLLSDSKIILTSRYIQEIGSFKQFVSYQICPLTEEQKLEITKLWIEKPAEFIKKLKALPYYDLSDRPLFLTFLILLFINNNDSLPLQSIDVYRQIVLLVIREWDADKEIDVKRYSKYKTFDTYKKEDFLSELAFNLTYMQSVKKSFTHRQLELAYLGIFSRYPNLTQNDETDVLKDIEAHNGLLIETSNKNFEFSHLSLQEYLCAKFLVTVPFSRNHYELLNTYAAPFAIANILSPRPDEWFAMLFLNSVYEIRVSYQMKSEKIYEFLDRLIVEKIKFPKPSAELGLAVIYLKAKFSDKNLQQKINEFGSIKYVYESLLQAEKYYNIRAIGDEYILEQKKNIISDLHINSLDKGRIKKANYWKLN